jgi:hypothetical protein
MDERAQRLGRVEGVSPFAATALIAAVGKPERELAARLGPVPSSASRNLLLGMSKRSDAICAPCSSMARARPCVLLNAEEIDAAFGPAAQTTPRTERCGGRTG